MTGTSNRRPRVHDRGAAALRAAFLPRTGLLIAAALLALPASAVQFGPLTDLQTGIGFTTVLTLGPEDPDPASNRDGCVYAVNGGSGAVHRICFDATKTVTSNQVVVDLNGAGSVNNVLGITFDPTSDPAGEMHLYLGYSQSNNAPFNGRIARAVSTDGGLSYVVDETFVTGLARSSFDHQTDGLDFGPDGCLYIGQGNNSNAGYDTAFAESRLSSAILRACFKQAGGGVDPAFDRDCGDGNTQEACGVEVYASGLRHPYDLVWHSNGRLYNADNDANPGFRDNCGAHANDFGCACEEPQVTPIGDEINLIEPGFYYGSPNPYRANPAGLQCQGGTDGGDACTVDADCGGGGTCEDLSALCTDSVCGDVSQCHYFGYGDDPQPGEDPNGLYREPIAQIGALLDGITEYRSRFDGQLGQPFCSDWNGDLLVTGGPGSVRRFELSADGTAATHMGTSNLNGMSGLDVVVGPDGTVYAADLNGGKVTYIEPIAQSNPAQADFFAYCAPGEACVDGACSADTDNDGLGDGVDPCPADPRNLCVGPVAIDGNTGNPIRLNANTSADSCAGTKVDCNGDTWVGDFGYNQAASNFTCDLAGGCPVDATPVFGCTDAATEDLYKCEHYDVPAAPELVYDFDVADGDYVVNVHLMNAFSGTTNVGDRVFNIMIEGLVAHASVDPVAAAGGSGIPVVRSSLVTVADGNGLQIEFDHVVENPGVKAIEVLEVYVAPECAVDADCDDANPCTDDVCNVDVCEHTDNTNACDDGASCTSGDVCAAGVCAGVDSCTGGDVCDVQVDACVTPSVLRRINLNGNAHTGIDFPGDWAADGGECSGSTYTNNSPINNTADDPLFQGERWGNPVTCSIDDAGSALPPGNYTVNLYLAEIYFGPGCPGNGGAGSRVFDVALEGTTVETGIDLFAEAGCAASTSDPTTGVVVRSYEVTITDGSLDAVLSATANNAKISAIEIISAGAPFECSVNADCDDGDLCTANVCNGGSCTYPFDGAQCIASYPYTQSFDEGTGGWNDVGGDDFDWTLLSGPTPTPATGPDDDHTLGAGSYLYTEATGFTPGQSALLEGPCIDLAGMAQADVTFWLHMLGADMGSLDVEAADECGSTWSSVYSIAGEQGPDWQQVVIDLDAYAGGRVRLRFAGTTGASDTSDLAIDDVYVTASIHPPTTVPTEIQMPGTQPHEVGELESPDDCALCHQGYAGGDDLDEPSSGWGGSMMSHASRDPVFWAALAVAEQDFDGSGDLCLRCHVPKGWYAGRSEPTDGSALLESDAGGVSCDLCHRLTNPDGSELLGVQNPPFIANDGGAPAQGYHGSAMAVLWDQNGKLGPYDDATPPHGAVASQYHRSADLCGTCHDVSNPLVGDLAPNNGAMTPLAPGTFSGVLGAPVQEKAAFNNLPHQYGTVERTSSEHAASAFATLPISDFATLPADLQAGALLAARDAALLAGQGGDYADGTTRTFSCQSCHMRPRVGEGASGSPGVRTDLPAHDLTGGNYWAPAAIQYLDGQGKLRLGGNISATAQTQMNAGALRAQETLEEAASLAVTGNAVRVVNLTGHKLITGYPEGRRMWLNVKWYDAADALIAEDGAYGTITANIDGVPTPVETLLDPDGTVVYAMEKGISQEWAAQLISLGRPASLPLSFDRETGAVAYTLGDLAAQAPGTHHETQHFVLNDVVVSDTRIPPYGMSYDEALARNALPVPADQYGDPGPGGTYDYWDDVALSPPPGAHHASIELLYQPTSWEYIQFLHEANTGASAFLQDEGANLLEAWLNTGMAAPHTMAATTWTAPACSDTVDNDGDGLVDALDPGCDSPEDTTETCGAVDDATCDGIDDDCDGLVDEDFDDALCSDGLFCNGAEACVAGACAPGVPPSADDGVGCTDEVCNETLDVIEHVANDGNCANGSVCDGSETCDPVNDCQPGTPLDCSDGNACTLESCDPLTGCQSDGPLLCDNADVCDGSETCDPGLGCVSGSPLDCDDGDVCTADSCDEIAGCVHDPIPNCPYAVPASPPFGPLVLGLLLLCAGSFFGLARGGRLGQG